MDLNPTPHSHHSRQTWCWQCCSVAFVLVPRKPKSPPRQKPSSRAVSPARDGDAKDRSYRNRDGREAPRERDYRSRRPLSPPRRRGSPMRDSRDYRRRPLSPPRSRRHALLSAEHSYVSVTCNRETLHEGSIQFECNRVCGSSQGLHCMHNKSLTVCSSATPTSIFCAYAQKPQSHLLCQKQDILSLMLAVCML